MKIIGAGLAGLLAGNMLRKYNPTILESAPELPNNHTALLRHRESKISEATAIPFKKVKVKKVISYNNKLYSEPNILFSNLYSRKVTGGYFDRSIDNLETATRFIAPPDFISQLSIGCDINYNYNFDFSLGWGDEIIISTIPMPIIAKILGYNFDFEFEHREINVVNFFIKNPDCELYQTIYYPDPNTSLYRGSITGNKCIFEFLGQIDKSAIFKSLNQDFGIESVDLTEFKEKQNKYGKIKEVESQQRKDFIGHLTKKYNIYSLGRYATWRNLLLDDVHDDILVIKRLIETNGYIT